MHEYQGNASIHDGDVEGNGKNGAYLRNDG